MCPVEFYLHHGSRESLQSQIAKQIEYYIAVGELTVGDRLPTIRDLETTLGVNRHTIRKAYLDLERRGLLNVRRGSGVTVATGPSTVTRRQSDPAIDDLMESTLRKAKKLGYTPGQLARMMQSKALELDRKYPSVAVVECSMVQAHDLALALEVALGQCVLGLDLGRLRDALPVVPKSVRYVVVPIFHADEVRSLLKKHDVQIIVVRVEIGREFKLAAQKLPQAKQPCMVLRDEDSISLLPSVVEHILDLQRKITPVLSDHKDEVRSTVKRSDMVFYTAPCRRIVKEVLPAGKRSLELTYEFTTESLELIRRSVSI